jgi:uncharacterized membrane protein
VRPLIVCLAVIASGMVLGANVYTSVVDARSWGRDIPRSLAVAKQYFAVVSPGTFFRIASPVAQALALLALIACWSVSGARIYAAAALVVLVCGDLLTFKYFYPRNAIMFGDLRDANAAMRAWRGWTTVNHVRSAIVLAGLSAQLLALVELAAAGPR